jgi:hypothetical protein
MVDFERELNEVNGQHFVYVRRLVAMADDDWVEYCGELRVPVAVLG